MFYRLYLFRRLLATTFLAVFVNMLVGQCWCATVNAGPAAAGAAKSCCPVTAVSAKPAHASCHGHGAAPACGTSQLATAPHKAAHPAHKSSRSHNCCRDKSASLLSSLTTPAGKHMFDSAPALLPLALEFHFPAFAPTKWNRTAAVRLVPPQHLPPKIPDIRIFIQSLTV